jgi:hypothetical protein
LGWMKHVARCRKALDAPHPIGRVGRSWDKDLRARALVALLLDDRQQAILAVEGVDVRFLHEAMAWCMTADDMEVCYAVLGLGELAAADPARYVGPAPQLEPDFSQALTHIKQRLMRHAGDASGVACFLCSVARLHPERISRGTGHSQRGAHLAHSSLRTRRLECETMRL